MDFTPEQLVEINRARQAVVQTGGALSQAALTAINALVEVHLKIEREQITEVAANNAVVLANLREMHTGAHLCYRPEFPISGGWYRIGDSCPTMKLLGDG